MPSWRREDPISSRVSPLISYTHPSLELWNFLLREVRKNKGKESARSALLPFCRYDLLTSTTTLRADRDEAGNVRASASCPRRLPGGTARECPIPTTGPCPSSRSLDRRSGHPRPWRRSPSDTEREA